MIYRVDRSSHTFMRNLCFFKIKINICYADSLNNSRYRKLYFVEEKRHPSMKYILSSEKIIIYNFFLTFVKNYEKSMKRIRCCFVFIYLLNAILKNYFNLIILCY